MKAVILIGGFGTRLRPLSCTRPKAVFPILNKPLLQWTFERLVKNGMNEAILAVNKQTEFYIKEQKIPKKGLKIKYSRDPPKMPLGTAGPIKKAENLINKDEPFIALNGDIFADINYKEIIKKHKENQSIATIALYEVGDPSRYGVAKITSNNRIESFIEKPSPGTAPTNLINAGAYVLSPKIFDYIPENKTFSMERDVFPKLAKEKMLFGYPIKGFWMDIGKPEEFLLANKRLLDIFSDHKKSERKFKIIKPVELERGITSGMNSVIGPYTVLGRNVSIGNNVLIKNSVIFSDAIIEDNSIIDNSIIGEGAKIGKEVTCKECILADQAKIKDKIIVPEKLSVCPGKEISEETLKLKSKIIC